MPVKMTDMCRETKRCPLSNGETITYYTVISNEYPTVSTVICLSAIINFTLMSIFQHNLGLRSTMVDRVNGSICTCFEMQVRIV